MSGRARSLTLREGASDVTVFCPITRGWCVDRFFDALGASDVPFDRALMVAYVDSDDEALLASVSERALALPFAAVVVHFSAWRPPGEYDNASRRRTRHAAMRCASAGLMPPDGELLLLEDDTLVPPDVWALLSAARSRFDWVSGFEVGRWSVTAPGVWRIADGMMLSPRPGRGTEGVSATGIYCVLTTTALYRLVRWDDWDDAYGHDVSCTYALTNAGYRLGVEWRCRCVHMTEKGDLTCDMAVTYSRPVAGPPRRRVPLPIGEVLETGDGMTSSDRIYYAPHRIVVGGVIKYGKKAPMPWDEAVALARAGIISDPALTPYEPRDEVKPDGPSEGKGLIAPAPGVHVCTACHRAFKTEGGLATHMRAKHDA